MIEILLAIGVFLLAALGMAIGLILAGKRLKGSCGGAIAPDGTVIGDCLCAREKKPPCDRAEPQVTP